MFKQTEYCMDRQSYSIVTVRTTGLPLGGEESIEACALGVFQSVL